MVEQVKSVDFTTRKVKFIGKALPEFLEDVIAIVDICIK
jgi:putative lipoic acid-binding regulatory protein